MTTGDSFFWLCPEALPSSDRAAAAERMTLVGLESLLCLREACRDAELSPREIEDVFIGNARRVLERVSTGEGNVRASTPANK